MNTTSFEIAKRAVSIDISLETVWRQAEVDCQTFAASKESRSTLLGLEDAIEAEPGLIESEWCRRVTDILQLLPEVREIGYDEQRFYARFSLPQSSPEGIGGILNALARAYIVKSLLALWRDLCPGIPDHDWKGESELLLERFGQTIANICRGKGEPRRITQFP